MNKSISGTLLRFIPLVLAIISTGLGVCSLVVGWETLLYCCLPAVACSGVALGVSLFICWRARENRGRAMMRVVALAVLFVVLVGECGFLFVRGLRDVMIYTASGENLRTIYAVVGNYRGNTGTYPENLQTIFERHRIPQDFIAIFDPLAPKPEDLPNDRLVYSSYVYTPGIGTEVDSPDIILAYEREPFYPPGGLHPQRMRLVLFGDGYVDSCDEDTFRELRRKDAARRREFGWAATQSAPAE